MDCDGQKSKWGPVDLKGYWTVIREGDDLKIRNLTFNVTPAPPALRRSRQSKRMCAISGAMDFNNFNRKRIKLARLPFREKSIPLKVGYGRTWWFDNKSSLNHLM
jgi:hypothetical protein